jgi:two-component system sensor histidine kinase BarA
VLIGLAISALFGFRLVKSVTQPITDMVQAVHRIREGRLDTRVSGQLTGELDMLKNGINAMAKALSEYHEEMQQNIDQATSDLRETLEQIEIQNVELDMAKKRAQEAARSSPSSSPTCPTSCAPRSTGSSASPASCSRPA